MAKLIRRGDHAIQAQRNSQSRADAPEADTFATQGADEGDVVAFLQI
jgi:hypothetical protein